MEGNFLFRAKALFLLFIVFTFWQCQNEDDEIDGIISQEQIGNNAITKTSLRFEKISKEEFLKNTEAALQISKHFDEPKSDRSSSSRAVESNGLVILDDEVLFIGNDDNHTYTFKALSSENDVLLNIVLALQEDSSYEANLLVYDVTQEELEMYYNEEFVDFENRITYTPIDLEADVLEILTNRSFNRSPCLIDFFYTNGDQNFTTLQACQNFGSGKCEFVPIWGQCPDAATDEIDSGSTGETGSSNGTSNNNNNNSNNNNDNSSNGNGTAGDETDNNTSDNNTGAGSGNTTTNDNNTNNNDNQSDNQDAQDTIGGNDNDFETNPFGQINISNEALIAANIENNIDDNELNDCHKGILTQIKNLQQNDVKEILMKFQPTSAYNLKMKTETLNPLVFGNANWQTANNGGALPYNYIIKVTDTPSDVTDLGLAQTIIHELIHTLFFSYADDLLQTGDDTLENNFPELWNWYVENRYSGNANNVHHETLANLYIDTIARALQEFHTGTPVQENTEPMQVYSDMAWGGLNGTDIFDQIHPPLSQSRQRIADRIFAESFNETAGGQSPIGSPCSN